LLADKVDVALGQILADDETTVVALGVVPGEAVVEEVVEDGHAGLVAESVVLEDAVGLRLARRTVGRPRVELNRKEHY